MPALFCPRAGRGGQGGEQRTWVADVGDRIVGFADTAPSRDEDAGPETGELCSIYLDESVARRGVGTALLSRAMNDLRSRGFVGATLWVLDTNHGARSFYEELGRTTDSATKSDSREEFELHEVRYRVHLSDLLRTVACMRSNESAVSEEVVVRLDDAELVLD